MKKTLTIRPGQNEKKNGKYTKKQMVIPGNLPSQLRVLDSSQQLYVPLFVASYCSSTHTISLKTPRKTPPFFGFAFPPFFRKPPSFSFFFFLLHSLYLGFAFSMISAATTFFASLLLQPPFLPHSFYSHLFCPWDPPPESSSMCQSPTTTSKSEVDSLWPLRM